MATPVNFDNFEQGLIPLDEFNHHAHVSVAYELLSRFPIDMAIERMRTAIHAYNAHHNVEQTQTSGYHESLTIAWMRIIHCVMAMQGPAAGADAFLEQNPFLLCRTLLRLYYSRERIMSWDARTGWVEPDLAPLPEPPPAASGGLGRTSGG
jgi:hypothetical protein